MKKSPLFYDDLVELYEKNSRAFGSRPLSKTPKEGSIDG
jgi:hypothetical protein